jgi:hypothetical protein
MNDKAWKFLRYTSIRLRLVRSLNIIKSVISFIEKSLQGNFYDTLYLWIGIKMPFLSHKTDEGENRPFEEKQGVCGEGALKKYIPGSKPSFFPGFSYGVGQKKGDHPGGISAPHMNVFK